MAMLRSSSTTAGNFAQLLLKAKMHTRILGHENIMNTLKYAQLVDFEGAEYTSKATKDAEEAKQLIEAGFEYVCNTPDEIMLFRKRK